MNQNEDRSHPNNIVENLNYESHTNNQDTYNNQNILDDSHGYQDYKFLRSILLLFDIFDEEEAYYRIIFYLIKILLIIIFLNITYVFDLSYLPIIIFFMINDILFLGKELKAFKKEE